MITHLPIQSINRRADVRPVDTATVENLASSIASVGLINPIRVRRVGADWEVVAGSHRLAACESLGLADIECLVVEADDLHAELAMIDENLCRAELSPSDRAQQTARRKAIYLELHPETAHGANLKGAGVAKSATPETPAFTKATASVTGQSERTVRLDAERGEKVIPEVMALIRGTKLDTGTYLDKIKRMPPNEQVLAAKRDLSHARQQERATVISRRVVKVADEPLTDEEAAERQYAALVSAWNKAGEDARRRFRELIDKPVMDHGDNLEIPEFLRRVS